MKDSRRYIKQTSSLLSKPRSEVYKLSAERKQSRELSSIRNSTFKSQASRRSSLSDSESSDGCFEKKFYRCGCLNHNGLGCGHKYQNYLAELRQERMRKKQKLIDFFQEKEQKCEELVLSDDDRPLIDSPPETPPPRASQLQKIAELNQSAEFSIRKFEFEIRIVFQGNTYFKIIRDKEEAIQCLFQLQQEFKNTG